MDFDVVLIAGVFVCCFVIPGAVSAWSDRRVPWAAMVALLVGGGLVAYAVTQSPNGYTFADVPDALFRVVGRYFY